MLSSCCRISVLTQNPTRKHRRNCFTRNETTIRLCRSWSFRSSPSQSIPLLIHRSQLGSQCCDRFLNPWTEGQFRAAAIMGLTPMPLVRRLVPPNAFLLFPRNHSCERPAGEVLGWLVSLCAETPSTVNSTPTNTARAELHSMITFHHANTRGTRAAKLRGRF